MNNPFPTYYEEFIYKSRYARWIEEEKRREDWGETVDRLVQYYDDKTGNQHPELITEVREAIFNLEVMPSMRALMTAGAALDRCNVAAYNCAYMPVESPRSFDESMYILMCGVGIGYSVEKKYVDRLPIIAEEFTESGTVVSVGDSKEGWAKAFRQFVSLLYSGDVPKWDVSGVRPAGARLKTFGGRASGPEPLVELFVFTINLFRRAAGRRLTTIECHDLMCKIADIVVVGGVRRSAMISLSDVTDDRMRRAKAGEWWVRDGQRRLANNSAVYEHRRPDMDLFMKEWTALYESKSGERGLFNREAAVRIAGRNGRRDTNHEFGTNPCSEIILRPYQFCNLTEIVARDRDTIEDLNRKARIAAILGTIQSTFTDFKYLRKIWSDNCNEERLLGVSITGLCDHPDLVYATDVFSEIRDTVVRVNEEWAARLGIPQSTATTCVKPSGTVSQLVDSSSGMHRRFAKYYIRTVRADNKDPLTQFLREAGIPHEPDVMNNSNTVFSFPKKAPDHAAVRADFTALDELELWARLQKYWCEHKPSVTVNLHEHEWMQAGSWVFDNFDVMSGISFLPYDGGSYRQAPYQEITKEEYYEWIKRMPKEIDWKALSQFETEDSTTGTQEYACSAGVCEVVTIGSVNDG